MKHFKKAIAVFLTVLLLSTMALPTVAFAAGDVAGDHTSFDDFYGQMTDEEGNIDWRKLPETLFSAYIWIKLFEVIAGFFRNLFGIEVETQVAETTVAEVVSTVA